MVKKRERQKPMRCFTPCCKCVLQGGSRGWGISQSGLEWQVDPDHGDMVSLSAIDSLMGTMSLIRSWIIDDWIDGKEIRNIKCNVGCVFGFTELIKYCS